MKSKTKAVSKGKKPGPHDRITVIGLVRLPAPIDGTDLKGYDRTLKQPSHDKAPATQKKFDGAWDELTITSMNGSQGSQ